eukprot:GDKH01008386.1.p4 GENE.GDKH01008386.1~~GDKH01008386.1.p4  ORF type:complete len:51 (-),score=3.15 GDKH01008386.1:44-196(-)
MVFNDCLGRRGGRKGVNSRQSKGKEAALYQAPLPPPSRRFSKSPVNNLHC